MRFNNIVESQLDGLPRVRRERPTKPSNGGARVRAVDLARAAGLSVQQIRNYVDAGLLPPASRAANGYRIFTARHAAALTVARLVIDGYGWDRAAGVMRAVHHGEPA